MPLYIAGPIAPYMTWLEGLKCPQKVALQNLSVIKHLFTHDCSVAFNLQHPCHSVPNRLVHLSRRNHASSVCLRQCQQQQNLVLDRGEYLFACRLRSHMLNRVTTCPDGKWR
eukprot:750865-Hanusia_phi.AAC.1